MSAKIRRLLQHIDALKVKYERDRDGRMFDDLDELQDRVEALLPPAWSPPVASPGREEPPAPPIGQATGQVVGNMSVIGPQLVQHQAANKPAALVVEWRERARRAFPLESAPLTAEKRERTKEWLFYTNCANELEAALKGAPLVAKDEDDQARVAPGATIQGTGTTAKSATGDK